jgi:hypothetical protein
VKTISREQLRRVLHAGGVTHQRTPHLEPVARSDHPLYEAKKNWVLAAYAAEAPTVTEPGQRHRALVLTPRQPPRASVELGRPQKVGLGRRLLADEPLWAGAGCAGASTS